MMGGERETTPLHQRSEDFVHTIGTWEGAGKHPAGPVSHAGGQGRSLCAAGDGQLAQRLVDR